MKKGTIIAVIASVIGILLLIGFGVFLLIDTQRLESASTASDTAVHLLPQEDAETDTDGTASTKEDAQTAAALAAAQASNSDLPEHKIIFVGDSRTVGMGYAEKDLNDACIYIGASGEGLNWFLESGLPQLKDAMITDPDAPIVFNLGVNDLTEIDKYLEFYTEFVEEYPDHSFYFMSVNPVTDEAEHVTNSEIGEFNSKLRSTFTDQYLDCYTYLMIKEFESVDGVHYTEDCYCMIHDFVVNKLFK